MNAKRAKIKKQRRSVMRNAIGHNDGVKDRFIGLRAYVTNAYSTRALAPKDQCHKCLLACQEVHYLRRVIGQNESLESNVFGVFNKIVVTLRDGKLILLTRHMSGNGTPGR